MLAERKDERTAEWKAAVRAVPKAVCWAGWKDPLWVVVTVSN